MLVYVNLLKNEIASRIQRARANIFDITKTIDSVASSVTARAYSIEEAALNYLVDVQMKFTATGDYVKVWPLARHHYEDALQETKIVAEFSNDAPRYFIRQDKIYILSGTIIVVEDAITYVYSLAPADLANLTGDTELSTNTSSANGMPEEFQELWARRVAIEFKDNNGIKLSEKERTYERDLQEALDDFVTESLESDVLGALPGSASKSNDGYDL